MDEKTLNEETTTLYKKMLPQINAIAAKCIGFNRVNELADYQQEAWIAIREAVLHYSREHVPTTRASYVSEPDIMESNVTVMKPTVFANWYVQKALGQAADMREVEFDIFDQSGAHIQTISNIEFRKKKRQLLDAGYRAESRKSTLCYSELTAFRDDVKGHFEPADHNGQELLVG